MLEALTIGKLAKEAGVNPKTIRYYEEVGLLPRARRSGSGYRTYTGADLERLTLIRRSRLLGMSLAETKELVEYAVGGRCAVLESRLASLLEERLVEIDRKIEDFVRLRDDMRGYHNSLQVRMSSGASQTVSGSQGACKCIGDTERRKSDDKTTAAVLGTGRTRPRAGKGGTP